MYEPSTTPIPTLELPKSRMNFALITPLLRVLPLYARAMKFREPTILHSERLIDAYRDFFDGKTRLILCFRHAYGDDPQLMAYALNHTLPRAARRAGKPFLSLTHAHFVYGVEVPLWSGPFVRWFLPNVGALPVDHVHMDSKGMNLIRKTLADGEYPIALAPEGHVTHQSDKIGELETGTARFGFWCMDDLARQGRAERVVFLPISSHYRYKTGIEKKLSRFVARMEAQCGIGPDERRQKKADERAIADRLRLLADAIRAELRAFYRELSRDPSIETQSDIVEAALRAGERSLALTSNPGDSPVDRAYRVRSGAWDRIVRDDLSGMTPIRLELARRETGEAWYAMRHLETVQVLNHVSLSNIPDGLPIERYVEIADNLYDLVERLKGGTLKNRANSFFKSPILIPGEPIYADKYRDLYKRDKKAALQRVTDEIRESFEKCVVEYRERIR